MTKNPLINALLASLYIALVVTLLSFGKMFDSEKETMLIPIAMLSLFSLSASVMAYLFFFNPVMLYLDGEKKQAIQLGMQTVGYFGAITLIFFLILAFSARG